MANKTGFWVSLSAPGAVLGRTAERKLTRRRSSVILRLRRFEIFPGESQMKILSISLDPELLQLRRAALEAAGHEIVNVDSEKEALQTVQAPDSFDAVLLCHRFPDAVARQTVRLLRQSHPDTRVIYIAHLYGEWPEVEADRYIVGADGAEALVRVLQAVHA